MQTRPDHRDVPHKTRPTHVRIHSAIISAALTVGVVHLSALTSAQIWTDLHHAGPFICHADFRIQDGAASVSDLRALEIDVAHTLRIPRSQERVEVFLFATKRAYQEYLDRRFPGVPARRALYIKGAGPGMVHAYLNREFDIDLRHESTHALLHSTLAYVPLWLDEGLAEYFEVPRDQRANGHAHLSSIRRGVWFGRTPDLERLESKRELAEMGESDYRDAWAWVHFMLHGPPAATQTLHQYVQDLRTGHDVGGLAPRLKRAIPDNTTAFKAHFRGWR